MKFANKKKSNVFQKRALRVRKTLRGSLECPRMCVVKTNKHVCVQLIDDVNGKTLASASTFEKSLEGVGLNKKSKASAQAVGERVASRAKGLGITQVIFDRGPFKYHGILAAVADSARQHGLQF
jgi:large subunit ribosomal protein L18